VTEFDDRLRHLVRTIGEAAPQPPPPPDATVRTRRFQPSGPLIAVATFVIAVAVFGVVRVFLSHEGDSAGPLAGMVSVRHQVVEITLEADLSCDQAMNAGTSKMTLETWADFAGSRFRQVATFDDGSVRDRIAFGDVDYPNETYAIGGPMTAVPRCGEDLLAYDPTAGPDVLFFNPPVESPNRVGYRQVGILVPGGYADSLGRPATLYRWWVTGGYAVQDDGTRIPIDQVTEWYVDGFTGDVLERTFDNIEADRYHVRQTMVVVTDDTVSIDPSMFATDGYDLEWSGEESTDQVVTTTVAIPAELESAGAILDDEILADGVVTREEFTRAVEAWAACMEGHGMTGVAWSVTDDGWTSGYDSSGDEASDQAIEALCYYSYVSRVDGPRSEVDPIGAADLVMGAPTRLGRRAHRHPAR